MEKINQIAPGALAHVVPKKQNHFFDISNFVLPAPMIIILIYNQVARAHIVLKQ